METSQQRRRSFRNMVFNASCMSKKEAMGCRSSTSTRMRSLKWSYCQGLLHPATFGMSFVRQCYHPDHHHSIIPDYGGFLNACDGSAIADPNLAITSMGSIRLGPQNPLAFYAAHRPYKWRYNYK